MKRLSRALIAPVVCGLLLAGCGSSGSPSGSDTSANGAGSATSGPGTTGSDDPTGTSLKGTINVFAAASLTETFTALGKKFEAAHPGTKVVFNFGPSSGLAEQINQGAPADVFASASTTNMDQVVAEKNAANPTTFAKNVLEIAVPAANPGGVSSVSDLADPDVKVAVCQPEVPCGVLATTLFKNAGINVTPVSLEADVKAVLTKVDLGEVDAGLVYVTDVRSAGNKVQGIEIPRDVNVSTDYPIATLSGSHHQDAAQAFTDFVLSDQGVAVLAKGGFEKP